MKFSSFQFNFVFFIFCCLTAKNISAQPILSSRTASYDIAVALHPEDKTLTAEQTVIWTNPSQDTVGDLRFHVYLNAFKNNQSTYLKGGGGFGGIGENYDKECLWGFTEIQNMTDAEGRDLTSRMAYIQPDDENEADETVLQVILYQPVMPGETIEVNLNWQAKIPKTISRTGYAEDFYFLVQWFPKLGVYEPAGMRFSQNGGWNCHQYHATTEYYADFGVYNVDITVPENYIVGASGVLSEKITAGDRATYRYRAADVIDFAWTASPHFVEATDKWQKVDLRLLTYEDRIKFAPRIFSAAKNSFAYLDEFVGTYPYPVFTIVAPPFHGLKSGAMEYPTLVTTFAMNGLPDGMLSTETLTVHETVHQYFMQMLATNEQEEAWLDEGFTSYFEAKIMDKYYGGFFRDDYFDITIGSQELRRGRFFGAENIQSAPLSAPTYQVKGGSIREISYGKTAVMLWTLEGLVGEEVMRTIMQTYFAEWKFKHPAGYNFTAIVDRIVRLKYGDDFAEGVNLFLQQAIYGTDICDYAVADISNPEPVKKRGIFVDDACTDIKNAALILPENKVVLHRLGGMQIPVEIEVTFTDGSVKTEKWNGKERVKIFKYPHKMQIKSAEIDPARKIYIDQNFINNSRTEQPENAGTAKTTRTFTVWLQNFLAGLSCLV